MRWPALYWQILIALALAVIAGTITGTDAAIFGVTYHAIYDFVGTLFLNALFMIVVPIVMAAIITGISNVGGNRAFGRLGGKTLLYYLVTTGLAVVVGMVAVIAVAPGIVDGEPAGDRLGLVATTEDIAEQVAGRDMGDVAEVFLRLIPTNVVEAAAEGQLLGLIFFSLLFGFFMTRVGEPYRSTLDHFWQGVLEVMMQITHLILRFAPIGVFALVAEVVAETGVDAFRPLAMFFFTVLGALLVHFLVILPLLLRFVGGVNPWRHYRAMAPALLTAFSTSSSAGTLPVTMECVRRNAKVSNRTSSFVLPMGATINMDGTALYECVAVIFIAQAYGVTLTTIEILVVVLLALLTSVGVAAIPAASLVAIVVILSTIGLPAEAIGIILAVDRVLDMCRTSVNVFGDSCGAVIIGRSEGEEGILADEPKPGDHHARPTVL